MSSRASAKGCYTPDRCTLISQETFAISNRVIFDNVLLFATPYFFVRSFAFARLVIPIIDALKKYLIVNTYVSKLSEIERLDI